VVWEVQVLNSRTKQGDSWERVSYCDESGDLKWIFLDPLSGSVEKDEPLNEDSIAPKFNPGEFDHQLLKVKKSSTPTPEKSDKTNPGSSHQIFPITLAHKEGEDEEDGNRGEKENVGGGNDDNANGDLVKRKSISMADGLKIVKQQKITATEIDPSLSQEPWKFMFDPHDWRRMAWDFAFILPCLVYLTVMMPYRLCFAHDAKGSMLVLETCMDMIFIVDILVNFRTGYVDLDSGTIEYDYKKVSR
jgi:hypothetical protein